MSWYEALATLFAPPSSSTTNTVAGISGLSGTLFAPPSPQGGLSICLLEVTGDLARMSHLLVLGPKTLAQCGRDSQGYQHNDQHQHRSRDETRCHARHGLLGTRTAVRGQASAIAPRQRSGDEEYIAWKVLPAEFPRDK